eukprot:jgi/Chlat1/6825/Chrsp51S06515
MASAVASAAVAGAVAVGSSGRSLESRRQQEQQPQAVKASGSLLRVTGLRSASRAESRSSVLSIRCQSQRTPATMSAATATTTPRAPRISEAEKSTLIDSVKTFIFDCDGVIWKGDVLIEGVPETLDMLRRMGKKLIFVTNNSTKSRKQYLSKFTSLGLTVQEEEIFSSSFAAAAYLQSINFNKKVYVVGEGGIQKELDLAGIKHSGGPEDGSKQIELAPGSYMEHDHEVGAVVVGFDRYINYYKLQYATLCLRENPGCKFIATNMDAVTHLTDAQEWAGGGSMVGAIAGSSGKKPHVVGKPSIFMLDWMADKFGIKKSEICMVGDRLDTDILFGQNGGCRTLLVLSGVTTEKVLLSPENNIQPDFYTDKLGDLVTAAKALV